MEVKVYWIRSDGPGRIGITSRPRGGDWLDDEARSLRSVGTDVLVSLLTKPEVEELDLAEEPSACARNGIEFLSFPIQDRGVPTQDPDVSRFISELAARLRENKTVVVHCRMGVGRSALLVACLLASRGVSVEEAFKTIADVRGCPVPDVPEQQAWVDSCVRNGSLLQTQHVSDDPDALDETKAEQD